MEDTNEKSEITRGDDLETRISLDRESADYVVSVHDRLRSVLGTDLVGVYLHGSGVLGDFSRARSDIDIVAVSDRALSSEEKQRVFTDLSAASLRCPATALELHVVDGASLKRLVKKPSFELHLHTKSSGSKPDTRVDGVGHDGDPDLLMHYAVLRESGYAVSGPPASELFPEVPRVWLIEAFAGELHWADEHASPAYQVLTAARAWHSLEENVLGSKLEAGEWAKQRLPDPSLVDIALRHRQGLTEEMPDSEQARRFLHEVLSRLEGNLEQSEA